jgi:hypothetical protein
MVRQATVYASMSSDESYRSIGTLLTVAGGLSFISALFSGFDRRMTIASNLLIFIGVYLVLGAEKFIRFLSSPRRAIGTAVFVIGFVLICFKKGFWGGLFEIGGICTLFGGFLPKLMNILQKVPYIGKYFRFALPRFLYQDHSEELPL